MIAKLVKADAQMSPQPQAERQLPVDSRKPILEIFDEGRSTPPEVWDDLPSDLAAQHDHHIHGTPKHTGE